MNQDLYAKPQGEISVYSLFGTPEFSKIKYGFKDLGEEVKNIYMGQISKDGDALKPSSPMGDYQAFKNRLVNSLVGSGEKYFSRFIADISEARGKFEDARSYILYLEKCLGKPETDQSRVRALEVAVITWYLDTLNSPKNSI